MDRKYLDDVVNSLKNLRSEIICIMSGLGHGTTKFYTYLFNVVNKIDSDINFYSTLEV